MVKIIQGRDPGDEQSPTITDLRPAKPERVFEARLFVDRDSLPVLIFNCIPEVDVSEYTSLIGLIGAEGVPCRVIVEEPTR